MKILIGINVLANIKAHAYISHLAFAVTMGKRFPDYYFEWHTPERCSIDRMRNEAAKRALEGGFDYLMFVDDDVIVQPNTLESLLACDADIAMAETYVRGYPFNAMFFKYEDRPEDPENPGLLHYNDFEKNVDQNGHLKVDAVGFSVVLIKCSFLKKIPTPYFVTQSHGAVQFTEDVYFCLKCVQVMGRDKVKMIVDTNVPTGHILTADFVTRENRNLLREYAEKENLAFTNPANVDRGIEYRDAVEALFAGSSNTGEEHF
jgi:hypothetical protein